MSVKNGFTDRECKDKLYIMTVETPAYLTGVARMIRAAGKRVADADEPELAQLLALQTALNDAIQTAVDGQRSIGRSWAAIALATGSTRQAAFQRWGKQPKPEVFDVNSLHPETYSGPLSVTPDPLTERRRIQESVNAESKLRTNR